MKLKLLSLSLGLLLSVPGLAAAHEHTPVDQKENAPCDCQEGKHHHMHRDWKAQMQEREQKLVAWVNQYTPEKKAEWTKVLEERKALHTQWMSPENAKKREQWKNEKMAKMQDLKKKFDEGKITKEEFIKQAHGGKEMGHWKTFHELELAVEKKDNKQAAALLNQLLQQSKEHNQKIKDLLKK